VKKFITEHSSRPLDSFTRGYAVAMVLLMGWLLDTVVDWNPFDFDQDLVISRAYQGDLPYEKMPSESRLGRFIQKIVLLYTPLLRQGSFVDIEKSARRLETLLLSPLRAAFEESVTVDPLVARRNGGDKSLSLRRLGLINVHLFLCDLKKVEVCFYHTFLRNKGRLHGIPPAEFYPGYRMAVAFLLERLREPTLSTTSIRSLMRTGTWNGLDSQYRLIQRELVTPVEETSGIDAFSFTKSRAVPEDKRLQLLNIDTSIVRPEDSAQNKLERAFLWFDTKIVGEEGMTFPGVAGVITTMMGVLATVSDEPLRVLKFEHQVYHGSDFSFAVLVPSYSNIGNYSEWWVFPDFCNDVTGGGGSGYRYLIAFIDRVRARFGNRLIYEEIQVDTKEFLSYVKAPSTARPTRELQRDSRLLGDARGWLLELVTGSLFRAEGYTTFHRIRNTDILGDLELDVFGVRYEEQTARILLGECSSGFETKDVARVKAKIRVLKRIWPKLLRYLGLSVPRTVAVEGWLVTSQKLPRSKKKIKTIRVIDSKELEHLASKHGIPWMRLKPVFGEESRLARVLRAKGLGDLVKFLKPKQAKDLNSG
jgi:hypothetical protein